MDLTYAKNLLEQLADGIDPATGEVLPATDCCNRPEVIRALHTVLRALDRQGEKRQRPGPANAGKPWAQADDEELVRMFDGGCSKRKLCDHFQRAPGAIASRLVCLGKIAAREEFRARA